MSSLATSSQFDFSLLNRFLEQRMVEFLLYVEGNGPSIKNPREMVEMLYAELNVLMEVNGYQAMLHPAMPVNQCMSYVTRSVFALASADGYSEEERRQAVWDEMLSGSLLPPSISELRENGLSNHSLFEIRAWYMGKNYPTCEVVLSEFAWAKSQLDIDVPSGTPRPIIEEFGKSSHAALQVTHDVLVSMDRLKCLYDELIDRARARLHKWTAIYPKAAL
ncbi:hypothetical protein NMY22_g2792 [Coprinellus aureogranulatus]|nr:hypothetical protein NMY22_g2792 [Coprinellus aureogranulatus]